MSFILDALRKSEHERQRQLGPSIAELPVARPAPRMPPWAWAVLAALVAVNAILVAWLVTRESRVPAPVAAAPPLEAPAMAAAPPAATAPASPTAAAPAATVPVATLPAAPAPAREVRPLREEAVIEPAFDEPVYEAPAFVPPAAPDPALLPQRPPAPAPAAAGVPLIEQLPPQATAGLPALNMDLHIFASDPAQRAVFINGARYRQGERLPEGAIVEQITAEGAILGFRGQRFLLPRQ